MQQVRTGGFLSLVQRDKFFKKRIHLVELDVFIIGKLTLPKRKNAKHVSEREPKLLLESFVDSLDNDDSDKIFGNSDLK